MWRRRITRSLRASTARPSPAWGSLILRTWPSLTAIGAFSEATLGYFDIEEKEYEEIAVGEQTEVLSLIGDVALNGDDPELHAHVVLGRRDGTTSGGHLLGARVRPTLEVVLVEAPEHLKKRTDKETGLALISLEN